MRLHPALVIALLVSLVRLSPASVAGERLGQPPVGVAARVDDTLITEAAVERALGVLPRRPTPADREARTQRRSAVLGHLIDQVLILRECGRAGRLPSPARLNDLLRARAARTVDADRAVDAATRDAIRWQHCTRALVAVEVEAEITEAELRARWGSVTDRSPSSVPRIVGRRWELALAGFESLGAAESALRAAVAAGSPILGGGFDSGDGPGVQAWPVNDADPAWGRTLRTLAPGERSTPRRSGDTLVLLERLPGASRRGSPTGLPAQSLEDARPRLESSIRRERRVIALQALLSRLRSAARIEPVEAGR